jgi:hypothetical protein
VSVSPTNFDMNINVLHGTDVSSIATDSDVTLPAGVTVVGMTADGDAFTSGNNVDYSEPVEFGIMVHDANLGVDYTVVYTVTVTVL